MAEGLRPHYHQDYMLNVIKYYDKKRHCMIKLVTYKCMICGREYYKRHKYKPSKRKNKLRGERKNEERTID